MDKVAFYKEQIYTYSNSINKEAVWGALARAGTSVISKAAPKLRALGGTAVNSVKKSSTGKKMLVGSGLGAGVGAANYNPQTDDSRLGKALGGAAMGAVGGAALGAAAKRLGGSATKVVPKSGPNKLSAGTPPKQIAQYSTVPELVPNMPNFTTRKNYNDVIDLNRSQYSRVACDLIEELYMEKTAGIALNPQIMAKMKNIAARIKKLPSLASNADPMIRMLLGAVAGGAISAALTEKKVNEIEKKVENEEKKSNIINRIKDKIGPRGQNAFKGAVIGSGLAYSLGANKNL